MQMLTILLKEKKNAIYPIKNTVYIKNETVCDRTATTAIKFIHLLVQRLPSIETIENCMKLCPMIIQGLWEQKSPLLQLPHITEDNLKHFISKKV